MSMKRFCDTCDEEIEEGAKFFVIVVKRGHHDGADEDEFEVCPGCAMQIPLKFDKKIPAKKE